MWFKVDDKIPDNRKFLRLMQHAQGRSAAGLWLLVGAWSGANMTDGFCPAYVLATRWGSGATEDAELLVKIGLFEKANIDGDDGYLLHDFLERNPSKAKQLRDKEYEKRRNALYRDSDMVDAIKRRDRERCRYCAVQVKFSDHISDTGGTMDHVDPSGWNSLENVVVCCRSCNNSKADRTPEDWGFELLPAGTQRRGRRPWRPTDV